MVRSIRTLTMVLAACVLVALPARVWAQGSVQITAADAKVYLSADTASTMIMAVPVGVVLDIVAKSDSWYQVRLPKDASGFDRLGFVQKSKVKEMAAPAGGGAARAASDASAAPAPRGSERPTAAVLDFEFSAVSDQWGGWDIGKGIADLMVDQLLQTGQIRMLERKKIEQVLGEQDLSNSNRADPSAARVAQLSKVLGAKILIVGTVTKFGNETKQVGGGGGSLVSSRLGIGAKNSSANVSITVRAIDSSTSEILASTKGDGVSSRKGLLLGGAIGNDYGHINMTSSDFQSTILGEATEKAVQDAATKLATQLVNALR